MNVLRNSFIKLVFKIFFLVHLFFLMHLFWELIYLKVKSSKSLPIYFCAPFWELICLERNYPDFFTSPVEVHPFILFSLIVGNVLKKNHPFLPRFEPGSTALCTCVPYLYLHYARPFFPYALFRTMFWNISLCHRLQVKIRFVNWSGLLIHQTSESTCPQKLAEIWNLIYAICE